MLFQLDKFNVIFISTIERILVVQNIWLELKLREWCTLFLNEPRIKSARN